MLNLSHKKIATLLKFLLEISKTTIGTTTLAAVLSLPNIMIPLLSYLSIVHSHLLGLNQWKLSKHINDIF